MQRIAIVFIFSARVWFVVAIFTKPETWATTGISIEFSITDSTMLARVRCTLVIIHIADLADISGHTPA